MKITIYGRQSCPYCIKAKKLSQQMQDFLTEHITIDYHDIEVENLTRVELSQMAGKEVKTVPQIWLDDHHIGGYTELDLFIKNAIVRKQLHFK